MINIFLTFTVRLNNEFIKADKFFPKFKICIFIYKYCEIVKFVVEINLIHALAFILIIHEY